VEQLQSKSVQLEKMFAGSSRNKPAASTARWGEDDDDDDEEMDNKRNVIEEYKSVPTQDLRTMQTRMLEGNYQPHFAVLRVYNCGFYWRKSK